MMPARALMSAAEVLVDERPLHVDVAEDDAVHGVVQHHVEALERAHRGDLRHAEAAGVVAEADVAAELLADLVEGGAHEAEVLLRGVGAAEALGGLAEGHVVEQALGRRADDGDHVGAGAGGRLGLGRVLVDVAGGDDDVDVGLERLAGAGHELVRGAGGRRRCARRPRAASSSARASAAARRSAGTSLEREVAGGDALGDLLGVLAGLVHEVDERPHDAAGQQVARVLGDDVDERHVDLVDAGDAEQAQRRALGRVGRVLLDVLLDVVGDRARRRSRAVDQRRRSVGAHRSLDTPTFVRRRRRSRVGRRCRRRQPGEPVHDVEHRDAVADCVGDRGEEDLGLVGLRHAERVDREREHAQRREHLAAGCRGAGSGRPSPAAARARWRRARRRASSVRGGSTRVKSSTNSCVRAPPTSSVSAPSRSTSRATVTPSPTTVASSSGWATPPRASKATAREPAAACSATSVRVSGPTPGSVSRSIAPPVVSSTSVERVADHAAGGDHHAVADARRRAAEAVDGAVDDHLVGAERLQPLDGDAELGERGRAADLDGAVAAGRADDDAAQRACGRAVPRAASMA